MATRAGSWLLLVAILVAVAGCGDRPRAPALANEAVYQDDDIGVRFVAPEGWIMSAKTDLPSGTFNKPIRMVAYGASTGVGSLDLYALDIPAGQDVLTYLDQHAIGAEKWATKGTAKADTVNGTAATRYNQTSAKKGDRTRDLTAFARGSRTYLFALTYKTGDGNVRDQGRRAIDSATWK